MQSFREILGPNNEDMETGIYQAMPSHDLEPIDEPDPVPHLS